jgi:hypothetical protein
LAGEQTEHCGGHRFHVNFADRRDEQSDDFVVLRCDN